MELRERIRQAIEDEVHESFVTHKVGYNFPNELTDSLLSLLNEEVKKARIEELERLKKQWVYGCSNFQDINDRIAQLRSKE